MQREEPYLVLTSTELSRDGLVPSGITGEVWLVRKKYNGSIKLFPQEPESVKLEE